MPDDLNAISVFVAVAEAKGFRAAGDRLRVSASAVSQALRKIEEQLGVVLVQRTTRSVLRDQVLAGFLAAHPQIRLDLAVSNETIDIVHNGYDAGVQLGEVIDRDMIAVPGSGDLRLAVVGAPAYFARHPRPQHPRDLVRHECVN